MSSRGRAADAQVIMITRLAGMLMIAVAVVAAGALQFALGWLPAHTSPGAANGRFVSVAAARLAAAVLSGLLLMDAGVLILFTHYVLAFGAPSSLLHVGRAAAGGLMRIVYLGRYASADMAAAARMD